MALFFGVAVSTTHAAASTSATSTPSCTITVDKATVAEGETFTLKWETKNMPKVVMHQDLKRGLLKVNTTKKGTMRWLEKPGQGDFTDTFRLSGGTWDAPTTPLCEVKVNIVTAPPSCTITVDKATVKEGETFTLKWETFNMPKVVMHQDLKRGLLKVNTTKKGTQRWLEQPGQGSFTDTFRLSGGTWDAPTTPLCEVKVNVIGKGVASSTASITPTTENGLSQMASILQALQSLLQSWR